MKKRPIPDMVSDEVKQCLMSEIYRNRVSIEGEGGESQIGETDNAGFYIDESGQIQKGCPAFRGKKQVVKEHEKV